MSELMQNIQNIPNKIKNKKGLQTTPYDFSLKDRIAISFFVMYFLMAIAIVILSILKVDTSVLNEMMKRFDTIIIIILGGYFGQEGVVAFFMAKSGQYPMYSSYGGYGGYGNYGYGTNTYDTMGINTGVNTNVVNTEQQMITNQDDGSAQG